VTATFAPAWIDLEGAVNARAVVPGRLLRSDNLQDLTPGDVAALLHEHGVTAVIDLRTGAEVNLEGPGPLTGEPRVEIQHHSLYPEAGQRTDVIEADTIIPWQNGEDGANLPGEHPTVRAYWGYLEHRPDSIVASLRTIASPPGGGAALVHCAAGKDRTGLIVALAMEVAGAPRGEVVADYARTSERIERIVARLASSPTYAPDMRTSDPTHHAARPETMERVLELLDDRHGGALRWLAGHGFGAADAAALRARLTA
jgi:protein tyrosine/serine phosphatase